MMRPAMAAMGLLSQWWTRGTTISSISEHEADCNHAVTAQNSNDQCPLSRIVATRFINEVKRVNRGLRAAGHD
jgi:hypothetical protein